MDKSVKGADSISKSLVMGLIDAAALLRPDGRPVLVNPAFEKLCGLHRRALQRRLQSGATAFDLVAATDGEDASRVRHVVESNRPLRLAEIPMANTCDGEFVAWISFVPFEDPVYGAVVLQVIRDVSSEARIHDQYREVLAHARGRLAALEHSVEAKSQELRAALEELRRTSSIDPLTGLLNRRGFLQRANELLSSSKEADGPSVLALFDLDDFKAINHRFGYQVGDTVLTTTASALRDALRPTDLVSRLSGDQYLLLLPQTGTDDAGRMLEACRDAVKGTVDSALAAAGVDGGQLTGCFGVASYPHDGVALDALVGRAEHTMRVAKTMGVDRIVVYEAQPTELKEPVASLSGTPTVPRVLLVSANEATRERYVADLSAGFRVSVASTPQEGAALCRRDEFDVIVAEGTQADMGVAFLRESISILPDPFRVLLVSQSQASTEVTREHSSVDRSLSVAEGPATLCTTIDDELARRAAFRARVLSWSPPSSTGAILTNTVDELISEDRIRIAYQPIVTCGTREVVAFEALCRVESAEGMNIAHLFEIAARDRRIWELGRLVRSRAVHLFDKEPAPCTLFLNVHPLEMSDPEVFVHEDVLEPYENRIVLEVTERRSLGDLATFEEAVFRLRRRGFRFAIDDLGSGYAGLNSVALLSPDFIKIDMDIVRDVHKSPTKRRFLHRIVQFCADEGITVVAEGVECEGEASVVTELGCDLMQGYLLGRPAFRE